MATFLVILGKQYIHEAFQLLDKAESLIKSLLASSTVQHSNVREQAKASLPRCYHRLCVEIAAYDYGINSADMLLNAAEIAVADINQNEKNTESRVGLMLVRFGLGMIYLRITQKDKSFAQLSEKMLSLAEIDARGAERDDVLPRVLACRAELQMICGDSRAADLAREGLTIALRLGSRMAEVECQLALAKIAVVELRSNHSEEMRLKWLEIRERLSIVRQESTQMGYLSLIPLITATEAELNRRTVSDP